MPKIKILSDKVDLSTPKSPPKSKDMATITERFQLGNNYRDTLDKSFTRERHEERKK